MASQHRCGRDLSRYRLGNVHDADLHDDRLAQRLSVPRPVHQLARQRDDGNRHLDGGLAAQWLRQSGHAIPAHGVEIWKAREAPDVRVSFHDLARLSRWRFHARWPDRQKTGAIGDPLPDVHGDEGVTRIQG